VVIGEPGEADAVDGDMAGGGGVESADEVEEGGLAGAGGSDEGDHFALGDGEGDAGEGDDFALAVEFLGEVGDIDHGEVLVLLKRMPEGRGWTEKSGGEGRLGLLGSREGEVVLEKKGIGSYWVPGTNLSFGYQ
jgi:hypothetical protein